MIERDEPAAAPDPAAGERTPLQPPAESSAGHYWQYCVNCGTRLEGRKCKLICPRCGFYHSCSEP